MERGVRGQLGVPGISQHDPVVPAPLGRDRVAGPGHRTPQHVEPWTEIPDTGRRERAHALRKVRHEAASARMSFNTPAAVTAGPAPGPVMMSGFV